MGDSRENADIWFSLSGKYPNGDWMGWRIFKRSFRCNPYFIHDSFGKYWSNWAGCRLFGHRRVLNIADPGEPKQMHCFNCEGRIENGY